MSVRKFVFLGLPDLFLGDGVVCASLLFARETHKFTVLLAIFNSFAICPCDFPQLCKAIIAPRTSLESCFLAHIIKKIILAQKTQNDRKFSKSVELDNFDV